MSRWKASAIHVGISILLLASVATVMALTWYPPLLAWADGKIGIGGILLGVDATLGPLLTLIVFKAGKPGLKFDLAMIAVFQMLALMYGLYVLFEARPVYIVFAVDRFELVSAVDIPKENLANPSKFPFQSLPLTGPEFVGVRLPQDQGLQMQIAVSAATGGPDIQHYPQFFVPYGDIAREAAKKSSPLESFMDRDKPTRNRLVRWLERNERSASSVKWLPLMTKTQELTVLIDSGAGDVLDILNIKP